MIHFQVKSDTTAGQLLYEFDAVQYFREAQVKKADGEELDKGRYVYPRALWKAMTSETPRVVLIDEIDKAPRDFPNDLLHELDKMEFVVTETQEKVSAPRAKRPKGRRQPRFPGVEGVRPTRTFAALGTTFALLGQLTSSETAFRAARRSDCRCCQTIVGRQFAHFLDGAGRHSEAATCATQAVEASKGSEKGRALDTLGIVRYHAGDLSGSVEAFAEALDLIPIRSDRHDRIRANLACALNGSDKLEDVQRAVGILRSLPPRFRHTKYMTQERAMVAWTLGETLAKLVRLSPDIKGWERRGTLYEARDNLKKAVSGLERRGLVLELAAVRSDLAAVYMMVNPFETLETLEGIPEKGEKNGKAFDLSKVKAAAVEAAAGISPDQIRLIWVALRALRAATVKAGAPAPILVYAPS